MSHADESLSRRLPDPYADSTAVPGLAPPVGPPHPLPPAENLYAVVLVRRVGGKAKRETVAWVPDRAYARLIASLLLSRPSSSHEYAELWREGQGGSEMVVCASRSSASQVLDTQQ